jgi:hypothetical protein
MEMGKLDEAEAKLKQATREDPEHRAAFYYLTLITERVTLRKLAAARWG